MHDVRVHPSLINGMKTEQRSALDGARVDSSPAARLKKRVVYDCAFRPSVTPALHIRSDSFSLSPFRREIAGTTLVANASCVTSSGASPPPRAAGRLVARMRR